MSQLRRRAVGPPAPSGREVGGVSRLDGAGLQAPRLWFKFPVTVSPQTIEADLIQTEILSLLSEREQTASACPSEVARRLANGDEWRALMPEIRSVLGGLSEAGRVLVTRGTEVLKAPDFSGGPIRFRRGQLYDQWLVSHRHDD